MLQLNVNGFYVKEKDKTLPNFGEKLDSVFNFFYNHKSKEWLSFELSCLYSLIPKKLYN